MAGIGFRLRALAKQDNLLDITIAYIHSSIVSTGPWIFTILAILGITVLGNPPGLDQKFLNFHAILFYNFAFSLIFASPLALVATRMLSDSIYEQNVHGGPGILAGATIITFAVSLPFVFGFYFIYANFPPALRLLAFASFYLIAALWIVSVFLTALKDYWSVTGAFATGMAVALLAAIILKNFFGEAGLLLGFSIGLAVIIFLMLARILLEYDYPFTEIFKILSALKKYKDIAIGGFAYAVAIWIDKIIMALAPEAIVLESGIAINFMYAEAAFLAYLMIIPSMAMFMINIETDFFVKYHNFYRDIMSHAPYVKIEKNQHHLKKSIIEGARNVIVVQGIFCFLGITLAHKIFAILNVSYEEIAIFRLVTLGGFFHVLLLFSTIMLYYFECRKEALWVQIIFAVLNGLFTYITLELGAAYYGYGYFLAALISSIIAMSALYWHVSNLPYHTFITHNTSLR